MFVLAPKSYKKFSIYILIFVLFLVHMKVNFAAMLDFFIQIYSSVTLISGPLSYYKKIYNKNLAETIENTGVSLHFCSHFVLC